MFFVWRLSNVSVFSAPTLTSQLVTTSLAPSRLVTTAPQTQTVQQPPVKRQRRWDQVSELLCCLETDPRFVSCVLIIHLGASNSSNNSNSSREVNNSTSLVAGHSVPGTQWPSNNNRVSFAVTSRFQFSYPSVLSCVCVCVGVGCEWGQRRTQRNKKETLCPGLSSEHLWERSSWGGAFANNF